MMLWLTMSMFYAETTWAAEVGVAPTEAVQEPELIPLGKYKITHYCPCRSCSGKWGYQTESGARCEEGLTVAVDKRVVPLGTELYIEGYGFRVAQDTGVRGEWIDVFYEDHTLCKKLGVKYKQVYIVKR